MKTISTISLGFALLIVIGFSVYGLREFSRPSPLPEFGKAPEFSFVDSKAAKFSSTDLQGKVWLFNFFFASCDGPCPIISTNLKKLYKTFEENPVFELASLTIDPEKDTPEALRSYAERMKVSEEKWHFLTGEFEQIKELANVGFRLGGLHQGLNHSNRIVLVDKNGLIRGFYLGTDQEDIDKLKSDIAILLMQ